MTIQVTKVYCSLHHRSRIYCCYRGMQRNVMDERILTRIGAETGKLCGAL